MPSSSVAPRPPPRPMPVMPAGGADRVSGTSSRPTLPAVRWSAQRHATRSTHSGGSHPSRGCRHRRAAERVDPPVLDAPLVDLVARHLDPLHEDRRGRLRLLVRVGPRERDACLARPTGVVREQRLVGRCRGKAAHAGDPDAITGEVFERGRREVGDDVGRRVARRVVHLVEQLVAQRVGADPPAGAGRLADDRACRRRRRRRSGTAAPTVAGAPTSRRCSCRRRSAPSIRGDGRRGCRPRGGPSRPTPSRARAPAARGTATRRRRGR